MYTQFFGFRELPFELTTNPRFVVFTDGHLEALNNLEYGVASRKGITLLVGESGSGKTTMIRTAIERQPAKVHSVHLHNPTLTREEFVELLSVRFGLSDRARHSKAAMLVELEWLLRQRCARDETTVLVVDEAQRLSADLLEEIRLLSNLEADGRKLLALVIAGQPELADRLEESGLRQLKQRVALRCELPSLDLRESVAYMAGRITAAGGVAGEAFTMEAVCLIHDRARGLPRLLNVIADNCLLAGLAAGTKPVDTQIVADVCRDFRVEGAAPEAPAGARTAPAVASANGHQADTAAGEPDHTPAPRRGGLFDAAIVKPRRFSFFRRGED